MTHVTTAQHGTRPGVAARARALLLAAVPFTGNLLTGAAGAALVRHVGSPAPGTRTPVPLDWPTTFAHRGGAEVAPENTLEAFRAAAALGDVVLELDVQVSADGTAVLMHDLTVDRTTDGTGAVALLPAAQLQRLDAGHAFTPDGQTFPWRGRGVRVPTLAEVYASFPDHRVAIELKGNRPGAEEIVWRTIRAAGAEDRTFVAANRTTSIRRFRRASGGAVPTAAAVTEFAAFRLLCLLGRQDRHALPFQGLQPPDTLLGLRVLTPRLLRAAQQAGLRVDVWTIDREEDMRRLLAWGVDGVMTDRPDLLSRVVREA
ncbi:glycerophosphodiester phosphodiesterase [Kocuria oceani]|uniref:Glycerophosphodiester phosphodiesterase n=1 Tax=Kocuria oceani TaxID=988827 RepID=A0ABV9TMK2_9MICC|nr:glycerophosphodiester phosphodiesterase [Kocuria oceani]